MAQKKSTNLKMDKLSVNLQSADDSGYFSPSFGCQLPDNGCENVDTDPTKVIRCSRGSSRKKSNSESTPSRLFVRDDVKPTWETNVPSINIDRIRMIRKANVRSNDRIVTPHLIGGYVSKEHVDFVRELVALDLDHVLAKIFVELTSSELNSVFQVSKTWRESSHRDPKANTRWKEFRRFRAAEKENSSKERQKVSYEAKKMPCLLKELTQNVDCKNEDFTTATEREVSIFSRFTDEARKLEADEKLDKCPRCSSPARVTKKIKRAVCSLYGCLFEYCVECRCPYSPEHKCDPLSPNFNRQSPIVNRRGCIRTAKKSLRRLLN